MQIGQFHVIIEGLLLALLFCLVMNYFSCRLLTPSSPMLEALGLYFKFEVTVGMNGKVWIHSSSTSHTVAIANAIKSSEYASPSECKQIAKVLFETVR